MIKNWFKYLWSFLSLFFYSIGCLEFAWFQGEEISLKKNNLRSILLEETFFKASAALGNSLSVEDIWILIEFCFFAHRFHHSDKSFTRSFSCSSWRRWRRKARDRETLTSIKNKSCKGEWMRLSFIIQKTSERSKTKQKLFHHFVKLMSLPFRIWFKHRTRFQLCLKRLTVCLNEGVVKWKSQGTFYDALELFIATGLEQN